MSGFQKTVNLTPAPAVAGDFASSNPRATVLAGPGGFVAGALGVTVGKFAWVDDDGVTVQSFGTATKAPNGFVHREQQALIQTYLAESGMNIPHGFPVTLHNQGDFWAVNKGPNACAVGDAVYADYSNGDVYTVSAPTGASATGAMGATFTASGSGTNLTVSAVTGVLTVGETLSGTGIPAGTTIVSQTSGTTGGAGVYVTSAATTISAATATSFGNTLVVSAVASGSLKVGDPVSGTGIPSGAVIASQVSGTAGGVGTYTLDQSATAYAASTTVTVTAGVAATGWKAQSVAAVGELVKISTWG
jgi:hypothetical protein